LHNFFTEVEKKTYLFVGQVEGIIIKKRRFP